MPITVCVIEDDRETRESLVELLNGSAGLQCVGSYPTGELAARAIPAQKPDVALVDINLPGMSGIECVSRLKAQLPGLQVLMLTTYEDSDLIFNSLRAGAKGYLLKKMAPTELIQAVMQVHAGGAPMPMQIARKVVDYFQELGKSASEMEAADQTGARNSGAARERLVVQGDCRCFEPQHQHRPHPHAAHL